MDADKPTPSINLAQHELDKARTDWSAEKVRRTQREAEVSSTHPDEKARPDSTR